MDLGRTNTQRNGYDLELRVASFCQSSTGRTEQNKQICSPPQNNHIEVLGNVADNFEGFLDEKIPDPNSLPQTDAQTRQELYNPKPMTQIGRLPESARIWIRCTAQEIMRWLLNLSISSAEDVENYQFHVNMNQQADSDISRPALKIFDILKRMPAILNKMWGDCPPSIVVTEPIEDGSRDEVDSATPPANKSQKGQPYPRLESLLPYFPILRDLANKVQIY